MQRAGNEVVGLLENTISYELLPDLVVSHCIGSFISQLTHESTSTTRRIRLCALLGPADDTLNYDEWEVVEQEHEERATHHQRCDISLR